MSAKAKPAEPGRAAGGRCEVTSWILNHGDCLDPVSGLASLADRSVDVTITDPPYEAEAHTKQRRQKACGTGGAVDVVDASLTFDAITEHQRNASAAQIARVTRKRAIVFCQVEAVAAWRASFAARAKKLDPLEYRRTLVWVKPDAMPSLHGRYPGQAFEAMILLQRPSAPACPVGGKARIYEFMRANDGRLPNPHPTTKPLPLMRQIVEDFSDPGDLILDPFAGSGTTAIAALMHGRRFVGWERDANYHAIATRRINGDEAKPREEQPSLFGSIGGAR